MSGYEDWSRAGWRAHLAGTGASAGQPRDGQPSTGQPSTGQPSVEPELVDRLGEQTIPALAAAAAARVPGRVAVSVDGHSLSHAELDDQARRIAGWLAGRVRPGDRVLLAAGSHLGFVRCYLGALHAGAVVVLANPAYTAAELGHLVADSGATLAFADREPARRLADLASAPLTVDAGYLPDPGNLDRAARVQIAEFTPGPQDTALLAYTSGTTGRPKGVPLTHRQLAVSIRSAMAAWHWTESDVLVHALPLYHQHGLGGVHAALIAGGTVHVRSRFSPADLAGAAGQNHASVLFAVPTIYQALLDAGTTAGSLRDLRLAVCGSAPLSPALAARLPDLLGRLPLVRYGTTESGLDVSNPVAGPHGDTIGIPLPGVLARIRPDTGADAEFGADGEIQLRGPQVFAGYWGDAAATAGAFTADGWFRTGDIGAVDPVSGHLMIRGRTKEMIITGGLNVYPREVELALEEDPAVAEAAVAGVPHERWGEQVTAWVVLRDGHDFDEARLIAHARTRLAGYKCPKQVFQIGSLPRNHLGKIVRSALG